MDQIKVELNRFFSIVFLALAMLGVWKIIEFIIH